MPTCYININPKTVEEVSRIIPEKFPDSVINLIPIQPKASYAPNSKKKYHRITFEAIIPEDVINGPHALLDFGGYMVLRLPRNRIVDKFLKNSDDD